jgi:hypothetical protein
MARMTGSTGVTEGEAILMLQRSSELAARIALGDGITRQMVAIILHDLAAAIETQDCAEDMSPIQFPMD